MAPVLGTNTGMSWSVQAAGEEGTLSSSWHPWIKKEADQCAKKLVPNSLKGRWILLYIRLVNSVLHLPSGRVKTFGEFKLQKNCPKKLRIDARGDKEIISVFLLHSTTAKRICCPIYWNVISLYMISLEVLTRWMKPHGLFQVIFLLWFIHCTHYLSSHWLGAYS